MNRKNIKFNIIIIFAIFVANLMFLSPSKAAGPTLRGSTMGSLEINNEFEGNAGIISSDTQYSKESKTISKGAANSPDEATELIATVNKSKMVKFDEPVKRVSLANPALADIVFISSQEVLINGKAPGATSLIIWGKSSETPVFFDLKVRMDTDAFIKSVKEISPDEDVKITTTDKGVLLSGRVSSSLIKNKIKSLADAYGIQFSDVSESPTPQVLLEVKIIEASRSFTRNLSTTYAKGNLYNDFVSATESTLGKATSGANFLGNEYGLKYFLTKNENGVSAIITAGEKKGLVKILAEPKLVTQNGVDATFNAGQQVPVPSGLGQAGNVSYSYKDVGINVKFNPTILEKSKRVILKVEPEVSEIDDSASVKSGTSTVYVIKTRKVSTTVEINDGNTLVIAGLLRKKDGNSNSQVPFLGDIPIIGNFFKSSTSTKEDTELMIFVTPRIIESDNQEGNL